MTALTLWNHPPPGIGPARGSGTHRPSTSRDASKSNGSAAPAERPKCDGSGIASITPVTVASTVSPTTSSSPIAIVGAEQPRGGRASSIALRGDASAATAIARRERQVEDLEELGSTATPNSRTACPPLATMVARSMTTARAILSIAG